MKGKFLIGILVLFLVSCANRGEFEVADFNPLSNFSFGSDTLNLEMDLSGAITDGIILPSGTGDKRYFVIRFKVKNRTRKPKEFFYKIYYQNETYKFREYFLTKGGEKRFNKLSGNNFYGSWADSDDDFHSTGLIPADKEFHEIIDSFQIVGNPRNEEKYFGAVPVNYNMSVEEVQNAINRIKKSEEWVNQIREKAEQNNISFEKQIELDAKWIVEYDSKKGESNNRWKRNPRTGNYSFLLVITSEDAMNDIPYSVRNISAKDTNLRIFINPFYYFRHTEIENGNIQFLNSGQTLKTYVKFKPEKGIYVNRKSLNYEAFSEKALDDYCGLTDEHFHSAQFEQYFGQVDLKTFLKNIPVARDVVGDNYTREQFKSNKAKYAKKDRINDHVKKAGAPGITVGFDSDRNALFIKNPGYESSGELKKENVGVRGRIGLQYGKYRAKVIFPRIISDDDVWNGLTCAFWLFSQEDAEWNSRKGCPSGYVPAYSLGEDIKREKTSTYSEIDMEIVKTANNWPETSYKNRKEYMEDDGLNDNIILACTNWDLACKEPENFDVGVGKIEFGDLEFNGHRWDDWYQALTIKSEIPQEEILGTVFCYEIEWQPEKIIWRIGKDQNNMKVVGYMDANSTTIPDNQLVPVISQEFHYSTIWPTAPFKQDDIPYPKKDIVGYVYEVVVE